MTLAHALTLGNNYTQPDTGGGGGPGDPPTSQEYVAIVLGRWQPTDDGLFNLVFNADGSLGTGPNFTESQVPYTVPYMNDDRWLHGSTDGSNYQFSYTYSGNTYATEDNSGLIQNNWYRLDAVRSVGFFGNWSGSGTKLATATFTIQIKKYTGTLGTGETVLQKVIGGNILLSGTGSPA